MAKRSAETAVKSPASNNGQSPTSSVPAPETGKGSSRKVSKKTAREEKGLRKHVKQAERSLADARKTETRRLRRLEKAQAKRGQAEALVSMARAALNARSGQPAPAPAEKAKPAPRSRARAAARTPAKAASQTAGSATADAPAEPPGAVANPAPVEAYCLRERKRVRMADPKPVRTANGGAALSGTCPSCGASLYKLVGRARA